MAAKFTGREKALAKLAAVPARMRPKIRKAIAEGCKEITDMQKRMVPVGTGALRDSIRTIFGNVHLSSSGNLAQGVTGGDPDLTATIVAGDADAWYARQVEFGTAPHTIGPRQKGGSIAINGNVLAPDRAVDHPGTAPRPFFYGPYRTLRKRVLRKVKSAGKKAVIEVANS